MDETTSYASRVLAYGLLVAGTEVIARGLRWLVVASQLVGQEVVYTLRGVSPTVEGNELEVITSLEHIRSVQHDFNFRLAGQLPEWLAYHRAFLLQQALGPQILQAIQPGSLKLEPYQLVPAMRAIASSRPRLMLADDVGLGKTIQAGLVIIEQISRRLAHRILIVSPAGPLMTQWQREMLERFSIRLDVIDWSRLEELRRQAELGTNPFNLVSHAIASIDFLKQERVLELVERASFDIIVIDEAHHCSLTSSHPMEDESQRRRLAEVLSRQCDSLLLLTATPHDGSDRSLASLCELLDGSLVDKRGNLRGERYRDHIVRRLKCHIKDAVTGEPLFMERDPQPVRVACDPGQDAKFIQLHQDLLGLIAPRLRHAFRTKNYADVLSLIALLKRSVSTVSALHVTLQNVARRYRGLAEGTQEVLNTTKQRLRSIKDIHRRLARYGVLSEAEELELESLQVEDIAEQLADVQREVKRGEYRLKRGESVVSVLEQLVTDAAAVLENDPKLNQLIREIRAIRAQLPDANVLVYTEYADSMLAAQAALVKADVGEILTIRGDDNAESRKQTTAKFQQQTGVILVSTDAAAEGLNLHQRCHHLIHLELPYNPNRMEQRNGRIDRYGQKFNPVIRYFYLADSFEERILLRLVMKHERQRARLKFVPVTLGISFGGSTGEDKLLGALVEEEGKLFANVAPSFDVAQPDENTGSSTALRELLEEIDHALTGFSGTIASNTWLGETGAAASEQNLREADQASRLGRQAIPVDLVQFVRDAVSLDRGQATEKDDSIILKLPARWAQGLEGLPGFDAGNHSFTIRKGSTADEIGSSNTGFLGLAHPLVKRAIERISYLASTGGAMNSRDLRVCAIKADVPAPVLIFTFMGRLFSALNREVDRVIAVQVDAEGNVTPLLDAGAWLPRIEAAKSMNPDKVWEANFSSWAFAPLELAKQAAVQSFAPVVEAFHEERETATARDRQILEEWAAIRSSDLTGDDSKPIVQEALFETNGKPGDRQTLAPSWTAITDPIQRLSAFSTDHSQPKKDRNEAEGVLRLYKQRSDDIHKRSALGDPIIQPLGVAMILPEDSHAA